LHYGSLGPIKRKAKIQSEKIGIAKELRMVICLCGENQEKKIKNFAKMWLGFQILKIGIKNNEEI
jgi:hypothetical protein